MLTERAADTPARCTHSGRPWIRPAAPATCHCPIPVAAGLCRYSIRVEMGVPIPAVRPTVQSRSWDLFTTSGRIARAASPLFAAGERDRERHLDIGQAVPAGVAYLVRLDRHLFLRLYVAVHRRPRHTKIRTASTQACYQQVRLIAGLAWARLRGRRSRDDPAPQSRRERLCGTVPAHRPDRGHRPDADLQRTPPAAGPRRVCPPLQPTTTPPQPPTPPAPARRIRHRHLPGADQAPPGSSVASSTNTSEPHRSPGQGQWPSSGTPQGQAAATVRLVTAVRGIAVGLWVPETRTRTIPPSAEARTPQRVPPGRVTCR